MEVLRPGAPSPTPSPTVRPGIPTVRPGTPATPVAFSRDERNVRAEGLRGAAARAMQPAAPPAVEPPMRTLPADPPSPRELFQQGASEVLLCLDRLGRFFDPIDALEPASGPLHRRLAGLSAAVGDRLYDATDRTTLSKERLLEVLSAVDDVRRATDDAGFRPDPATEEGRRALEDLLQRLDAALSVPYQEAPLPGPVEAFRQAAMEQVALFNRLLAAFGPRAQLDPASEGLYREILGHVEALTLRVNDLRHPTGMRSEDLLGVLVEARDMRARLAVAGPLDPLSEEGRQRIETLYRELRPFVPYQPAAAPTFRQNFRQAASEALLALNQLAARFDPLAQLRPASQPLYLGITGLMEALGDRLDRFGDPTPMHPGQVLHVLEAVEAIQAAADRRLDPSTEEGLSALGQLYGRMQVALALPDQAAMPPSSTSNFKEAAMTQIAVLRRLLSCFDPLAQLESDVQPLYRKVLGLKEALEAKVNDGRHPTGLRQDELLQVLEDVRALQAELGQEGFEPPDPRTEAGRARLEGYFRQVRPIVAYEPAKPPSARSNFMQGGMASLSALNKLAGRFDALARLEAPSQGLYLRLAGLIQVLEERTLAFGDKTGLGEERLARVLRAAERVRRDADALSPDPTTADGRRVIDGLFVELEGALGLPHAPAAPPTLQEHFKEGGMEALSVLHLLSGRFDDRSRLEDDTQPLYLKLSGLQNALGARLAGHGRPGHLHPAGLATLLRTARAIRGALGDPARAPDPRTADGRAKLDGFLTTLAAQLGMPFA